ncbi:hypothetical protein RIF29_12592 [Crotalaria pallida]|uniref:Neprosin PEP catalytic domain-containing protein n=1 Tax=Crotalaria pallida TaxID=3830 RepID=A0AAN9INH4_CROPI
MGKSKVAILLLGALFASCLRLNMKVEARGSSPLEIEIDAKLKLLNKPAVKTFKSEDGDIIDCVDIYKQHAFDHPALKDHIIQAIPDFLLESRSSSTEEASISDSCGFQTWQRSESCPKGTIPIARILKKDLLRATSLERFGMKPPEVFKNSTNYRNLHFSNLNNIPKHLSAAYLETTGDGIYIGSETDINVWNPKVNLPDDFTTAQMWLKAYNGPDFESVEAGWTVNPKVYGDKRTRLFAYWTKDSYKKTGCFDSRYCCGFVHTNNEVWLGAVISKVSRLYGPQSVFTVGIFLEPHTSNWWLRVNNNISIGYWPGVLFDKLRHNATSVQWGGQVFSSKVKETPHTKTWMGSGHFASSGQLERQACFINRTRIRDASEQLKYPPSVRVMADEPFCYNSMNIESGYEPVFYFGGPGQNPPNCP